MSWDPDRYLQHASPRLRPATDLLARIPLQAPRQVVDLGCGPGHVTRLLRERWPLAAVCGVDASPQMLARARRDAPDLAWVEADIAAWVPDRPVDLIFSNAALHWLDDHAGLLPRLVSCLAPGGVLAVQMPANFEAPSHRLLRALAAEPEWRAVLDGARHGAVLGAADYHRLLAPHCAALDLWQTTYWHTLVGDAAVLEWMRGSALLPYLERLEAAPAERFLAAYRLRLAEAYPPEADGSTLFPFSRLFLVATAR